MKALRCLFATLLLLSSMVVNAYNFVVDGIYYTITDKENRTVGVTYGAEKYTGDVVIPESVNYNGITYAVTSIVSPADISSSGEGAFDSCTELTSVTIPNSVISIGNWAFYYCIKLTNINIPNSVKEIKSNAFDYCRSLTSIIIPSSVVNIERGAFSGTSALESIVVEQGNAVYDSRENCNAIIESATNTLISGCKNTAIPNSIKTIGDDAFYGCSELVEVTIPEGVISIGSSAFSSCSKLTSVTIPNSVSSVGYWAFGSCSRLSAVYINDIESWCKIKFSYETSNPLYFAEKLYLNGGLMTELTIPNSIEKIPNYAFINCSCLTSLTIPSNITSIGTNAFSGTSALESIVIEQGNIVYDSRENCNAIIETATNTLMLGCKGTIIPNSIKTIGDGAFKNSDIEGDLIIPNSVTGIGYKAFYGCSRLNGKLVISNNVTNINDETFYGCGMKNVEVGNGVKTIGNSAFANCKNLEGIKLGSALEDIGDYAFFDTDNIQEVTISAITAPNLGENVFFNLENSKSPLITLNYPEEANYISWARYFPLSFNYRETGASTSQDWQGNWHYNDWTKWYLDDQGNAMAIGDPSGDGVLRLCNGLDNVKRVYVEDDFTSIERLGQLRNVEEIYVKSPIATIEPHSFEYCENLTKIQIQSPESLTSIGDYAFYSCDNLKEFVFSESLTSIGDYAFYECNKLKNIFFPQSLISIGDYAFYNVPIEFVVIPQYVTSVGNYAFSRCSYYDYEKDEWIDYGSPTLVFKSFVAPTIGDFDYDVDICVPEGANSYPSGKFSEIALFYPQQEYYVRGSKMYVFGNADNVNLGDVQYVKSAVFTPDATGYNLVTILPNIKQVGVLRYKMEDRNLYTIEGSNAIFKYKKEQAEETILVAGCATTVIPEGTTIIDENAFYECVGLETINIPNSVKSIGGNAFYGCTGLASVKTEDLKAWCDIDFQGSTSNPLSSGKNLYLKETKIADLVIPDNISKIKDYAFYGCSGLTSVTIPNSVDNIGWYSFANCTGLTSVTIPNSVDNIDWYSFAYCTGLKSVVANNKEIESNEFFGCTALETLTIGENVSSIYSSALDGCTSLANIIIDEGNSVYDKREGSNAIIQTANNKLIYACRNATIPSTVTAIGENAFNAFADFDITVPASVASIDRNAFQGVNRLFFESETPATIAGNVFGWGVMYVPFAAYDTYCNANIWSDYKNRIVTSEIADKYVEVESTEGMSGILNAIGLDEVDKVVNLKVKGKINSYDMIVIRDKMPLLNYLDLSEATVVASSKPFYQTYCTGHNSLGGYAFYNLDKLLNVKLPKDLKVLGNNAFYDCNKLMTVDASATAELNIGANAFYYCGNLREFVSPENISEIGNNAFYRCGKLDEIELRNISGSIGVNAFQYCGGLESIHIDSIGGDIRGSAFRDCSSLEEVKIGKMNGNLNNESFAYCPSLKSVEFGVGPAKIGSRLFVYSDNLENFVAGVGLLDVAEKAFYAVAERRYFSWGGWTTEEVNIPRQNLTKVELSQGVQKIGKEAFYKCVSLKDFVMPQTITTIGESAFYSCQSLESLSIPSGITNIASKAFQGCTSLKSVTCSEALISIGEYAFAECESLKNIRFSDKLSSIGNYAFMNCGFEQMKLSPTVKTIGYGAFYGCSSLVELHIPSSMESIGGSAFSNCNQLNDIYTYTIEPTQITETTFSTFSTATLHVPMTSFWNYYWNIGWSRFNHKYFKDFNEKYDYFYLNNDYYLNGETGYIEGTPDADLRPGSGLIVEADKDNEEGKQDLGDVNVGTDGNGNSASIIGDDNLSIENLHVKINVKGGRWYFFAFPWDVPLHRVSMQNGSDYVFRYYNGEERAKHGHGGWKDVHEPHLKAARGYIFQCSADDVLLISIEDVKFKKEDKYNELVTHTSENINDASWNLMGNPYLSYYDMGGLDYSAPVTVWDGEKYVAIRPGDDDYQFAPYEAFFVQKPEGKDNVGFDVEGQMTKTQATTLAAQQAAARRARSIDPHRLLINLVLSYEETNDRTRVVFNDRQSHNYEVACDAAKFQSEGVAQIYTLDGEGVRYAINERPMGNGIVQIGYTATENGYYTIEATRMDTEVYLYDAETKIMHNLDEGSYTFFSGKGTFEKRFTLGMQDGETTHIEDVDIDAVVEVVEGGIQFNANATVATVYNAAGMVVTTQQGAGFVQLPAGTYVVSVGEQNKKVVVK